MKTREASWDDRWDSKKKSDWWNQKGKKKKDGNLDNVLENKKDFEKMEKQGWWNDAGQWEQGYYDKNHQIGRMTHRRSQGAGGKKVENWGHEEEWSDFEFLLIFAHFCTFFDH